MRYGQSGASFQPGIGVMIKHGNARVVEQGLWLRRHQEVRSLPQVHSVGSAGYEMELLEPYTWTDDLPLGARYAAYWWALREIWSRPQECHLNLNELSTKITFLVNKHYGGQSATRLQRELLWRAKRLRWGKLLIGLTHGDPTRENVMLRPETGELVLIDPVPATPAVPSVLAVDFGKMLQSIVGWEAIRYENADRHRHRWYSSYLRETLIATLPDVHVEAEWDATIFWCAVHLLRALPYTPPELHDDVKELIDATLNVF